MSKSPSDATLLKREKALSRKLAQQLADARDDRDQYRARATKAETEASEWKQRFDVLLRRDQQVEITGNPGPIRITG